MTNTPQNIIVWGTGTVQTVHCTAPPRLAGDSLSDAGQPSDRRWIGSTGPGKTDSADWRSLSTGSPSVTKNPRVFLPLPLDRHRALPPPFHVSSAVGRQLSPTTSLPIRRSTPRPHRPSASARRP